MTFEQEVEKFWSFVDRKGLDECWPWMGSTVPDGYGQIMMRRGVYRAHRLAYVLTKGRIPKGKKVCHSCDNPACCNPAHLWPGTDLENVHDAVLKGRRHRLTGELHPNVRITEADVIEIRRLHTAGMKYADIGKHFGISRSHAHAIGNKTKWKHL